MDVTEFQKEFAKAWGKVVPFGAQVLSSAAAYRTGIMATQLMGYVCRISCATPVLGPCMGFSGVAFGSILAGQAAKYSYKWISTGRHPLDKGFWEPLDGSDVVLDAVLGAVMFKALGGRFSSIMPSDLSQPGALAFESIPAQSGSKSKAYAKPGAKRELLRIFYRDGCHHCGSRRGPVIGDHMPPNKLVAEKKALMPQLPGMQQVQKWLGLSTQVRQRFYPQCQRCSLKQAGALGNNKTVLVLHFAWPRYRHEHLAAVFVGLRHNTPPSAMPPFGPRSQRNMSKWNPLAFIGAAPAEEERSSEHFTSIHNSGSRFNSSSSKVDLQELCPVQLPVHALSLDWHKADAFLLHGSDTKDV